MPRRVNRAGSISKEPEEEANMLRKIASTFSILILVLILIALLWALTAYYENLPDQVSQTQSLYIPITMNFLT